MNEIPTKSQMNRLNQVKSIAKRLKRAREQAGYATAAEAARNMKISQVTYSAHENGGREYDRHAAMAYAKHFNVTPEWLMFGKTPDDECGAPVSAVRELDLRQVDADRSIEEMLNRSTTSWKLPTAYSEGHLGIQKGGAMIVEVYGDWMSDKNESASGEDLSPGDKVIVDMGDIRPSPPGVFVVWDGIGIYPSKVEASRGENGETGITLTPRNPRYERRNFKADDVQIIGRVKAKVSRL